MNDEQKKRVAEADLLLDTLQRFSSEDITAHWLIHDAATMLGHLLALVEKQEEEIKWLTDLNNKATAYHILQAKLSKALEIIENAPCNSYCPTTSFYKLPAKPGAVCTCWKATALKELNG